jgi:uncharacterized DUF497 family protein
LRRACSFSGLQHEVSVQDVVMMIEFEGDPRKAASNLQKHGVSFEEAITVFADPLRLQRGDEDHSLDEERLITIGQSAKNRLLFVV